MELHINNQIVQFDNTELTIQVMLDTQKPMAQKGIAIAINNVVVPRVQWATYSLNNSDDVLIITATQGG